MKLFFLLVLLVGFSSQAEQEKIDAPNETLFVRYDRSITTWIGRIAKSASLIPIITLGNKYNDLEITGDLPNSGEQLKNIFAPRTIDACINIPIILISDEIVRSSELGSSWNWAGVVLNGATALYYGYKIYQGSDLYSAYYLASNITYFAYGAARALSRKKKQEYITHKA